MYRIVCALPPPRRALVPRCPGSALRLRQFVVATEVEMGVLDVVE